MDRLFNFRFYIFLFKKMTILLEQNFPGLKHTFKFLVVSPNRFLFFQRWTINRQMRFEGGFQGRTNKLVDGCYSFWQGGAFPIIQRIMCMQGGKLQ